MNPEWVRAMHNIGNYTSLMGKEPRAFSFQGNMATVGAAEHEVQRTIDYFRDWLPRATEVYRRNREAARVEAAERERAGLRAEQEEIERQRRLRATIRL